MATARRALPLVLLLSGCLFDASHASSRQLLHAHALEHELHCARATMGKDSPYRMPLAPPVQDPAQAALLDLLPPEARHAARAGGLEPLLVALLHERASAPTDQPTGKLATLQHELTLRLIALETQVSSLAFETSCTRQRVGDLAQRMDRREGERQFKLAAASLVVGALSGAVAGVWDLRAQRPTDLPAIIGISGGVATAGLGAAALLTPSRAVWLDHAHNLLRPIAEGSDPEHLYPSFVFRMLTVQYEGEQAPARQGLLTDFALKVDELAGADPGSAQATLFGRGGPYDRTRLELREALLHALESAVQGVARDLELLNRSLVRTLTLQR